MRFSRVVSVLPLATAFVITEPEVFSNINIEKSGKQLVDGAQNVFDNAQSVLDDAFSKVKDGAKRRRESSNTRVLGSSSATKPKMDVATPQLESTLSRPSTAARQMMPVTSHPQQQMTPVPPPRPNRTTSITPTKILAPNNHYPNMI